MNRSGRRILLGVVTAALVAAPALAISGDGVDQDDTVSLLDIERTTYVTKDGSGTLSFFVNTYDDWAPAVVEKGRIRIVLNSKAELDGTVDAADYVMIISKPTLSTAGTTGEGKLLGNLFKITASGLQAKGQVATEKIAGDKVKVTVEKSRVELRPSRRMQWMVRTRVPQGGSGGSAAGVDVAPASGMFDSNTS